MKTGYFYKKATDKNGTLYTGVTSDLIRRVYEHKTNQVDGFTKKYKVHNLVYYEMVDDINSAIDREKQIKGWQRKWKVALIESSNPGWRDLYNESV
jgi:putative endonuclease